MSNKKIEGGEKLTPGQRDHIYGIQAGYFLEVGRMNNGEYGVVTTKNFEDTTDLYNTMISLVHEGVIK